MKKIPIPHLGYTVIHGIKKHPTFTMYCEKIDKNSCAVYYPRKIKDTDLTTIAHEVVHAIQYVAEARHIDMIQEQTHNRRPYIPHRKGGNKMIGISKEERSRIMREKGLKGLKVRWGYTR